MISIGLHEFEILDGLVLDFLREFGFGFFQKIIQIFDLVFEILVCGSESVSFLAGRLMVRSSGLECGFELSDLGLLV